RFPHLWLPPPLRLSPYTTLFRSPPARGPERGPAPGRGPAPVSVPGVGGAVGAGGPAALLAQTRLDPLRGPVPGLVRVEGADPVHVRAEIVGEIEGRVQTRGHGGAVHVPEHQ